MPKYVSFHPTDPLPRQIMGWWDTDAFEYGALPTESERFEVTDEQWQAATDDAGPHLWALDASNHIVPFVPPAPPPQSYYVPKLVLVDRLIAAGLLRTAFTALKFDQPYTALSDAELTLRERFNGAREFSNTDQDVRTFLSAIGGNVDALLAQPPPGS